MNPKQALNLIKELQRSDGWKYLKSVMDTEIIQASHAISDGMNMPMEEIHYRRGAIWALQDEDGNIVGLDASASENTTTATAVRR